MKIPSPLFCHTRPRASVVLLAAFLTLPGLLQAQESRWTGAVDGDWNETGNWIGGVPSGLTAIAHFGADSIAQNLELTSGTPALNRIVFDSYARTHTFTGSGALSITGSGPRITAGFGAASQTFNVGVATGGTAIVRNDSLSGTLTFQQAFNPVSGRTLYLRGLGNGVFNGNTRILLDSVKGGGTWTFAGENLSGPTGNNTWSGGSHIILDYRDNPNNKFSLPTNFYLRGAFVEAIGASTGTTTVHLAADKILPGQESFANGYGFASRFHGTSTGSGEVVFDFGNQLREATSTSAYVHFSGDATFRSTGLRDGGSLTHAVWVINDQYATRDTETDLIVGRILSQADAQNGTFNTGTSYYETNLAAGTTTRASGVTAKGLRVTSTDEATWQVNGHFLPSSSVGTSLLFAGEHNVTIQANGFGGAQAHWINLGKNEAVLTLDGPLSAGADHRKSGAGTVVLLNSESKAVVSSIQALHVGEGTLRLGYSQVMGSAPVNNGIYVQAGATVALQGTLSLQAGTTTYLHGLGDNKGGALRNHEGNNRLAGTVMFGTTASIVSDQGELELAGALDALENEPVTVIFGGTGVTRVTGDVSANITGGFYKEGSGTVLLEGISHSPGPAEIREGTFLLAGGTLSGAVAVREGAVFGGNGALGGSTLLDEGSTLRLELHSSLDNYLVSSHGFAIADDVSLEISLNQSATVGDMFRLVSDQATVTGSFSLVNGEEFLSDESFKLHHDGYLYTFGLSYGTGINATVLDIAAIPEPGVWGLLTMTGICCWFWRRRGSPAKTS